MNKIDFFREKKLNYQESQRKTLKVLDNGRSADFIIPNFARGCELGCSYCYVNRNNGFSNPLTLYTNKEQIWETVLKHYNELPSKTPNQCDPLRWTYDVGEATDCLSPKVIKTTKWFIEKFLLDTGAKPTFATKLSVGPRVLDPIFKNRARVRISLMPEKIAKILEAGTSGVNSRIDSIVPLMSLGYEVHINFSPVIAYEGWEQDYANLMKMIVSKIGNINISAEVIFLTHHHGLHESNMKWIPEAEELTWKPEIQEKKTNQRGSADVVRYEFFYKKILIDKFKKLLNEEMPKCNIRYIF